MNLVSTGGSYLGQLCAQYFVRSLAEFEAAVCVPSHPLQTVLIHLLAMRQNRRSRRTLSHVNRVLTTVRRWPRWLTDLMQSGFALYCLCRRAAAPRNRQPVVSHVVNVDIPMRVVRVLQRHGIRWMTERHRFSIAALGKAAWQDLWHRMQGKQVVLWVDNYYRKRYTTNPEHSNVSLNCTVMATLFIPQDILPPSVHMTSSDLLLRARVVLSQLRSEVDLFRDDVEVVLSRVPGPRDIRVPLDSMRSQVDDVTWEPLWLTELQVSRNNQFV